MNITPSTLIFLSVVGPILMGLAAVTTLWLTRKKAKAEINVLIASYYSTTFDELRKQIEELRKEVGELRNNEKMYKETIAGYITRERGHLKRITDLESREEKHLQRVVELEDQLSKFIQPTIS